MELICKRWYGIEKLFKVTTADGFHVGTLDLRGSHANVVDRPYATFEAAPVPKPWRDIADRPDGLAWLTGLWAAKVREWHRNL